MFIKLLHRLKIFGFCLSTLFAAPAPALAEVAEPWTDEQILLHAFDVLIALHNNEDPEQDVERYLEFAAWLELIKSAGPDDDVAYWVEHGQRAASPLDGFGFPPPEEIVHQWLAQSVAAPKPGLTTAGSCRHSGRIQHLARQIYGPTVFRRTDAQLQEAIDAT